MKTPPNPLSAQLRELRRHAGLTGAEAAQRAGMSTSKISRVETGKFMPTEQQVVELCRVYKASTEVRNELVGMIRALREAVTSARIILQRGGWQMQERIGKIESSAALLRSFASDTMTGLLQTEPYIRAMLSPVLSGEDLERTITARLVRQQVLASDRQFRFVITEGVLRWNLAGPAEQANLLDHVAAVSKQPNVKVGIIPWTTTTGRSGAHSFHLYDSTAVIVGTMTATAVLTQKPDLDGYEKEFAELAELASFGEDARAILDRVAKEYRALCR